MDIGELIATAKLGRERRDAQIDTCSPFAAALYDVLTELGMDVSLVTVGHRAATTEQSWYHLVLKHEGRLYDSMGEFSADILRKRLKIHPKVEFALSYAAERRDGCYEEEDHDMLHAFFVAALNDAARRMGLPTSAPRR